MARTVAILRDRRHCVGTLRPHDLHQMARILISPWRRVDFSGTSDLHQVAIFIRRRTARHDRDAIVATITRDRGSFSTESSNRSFPLDRTAIIGASTSQSTRDRGPIAARSWLRLKQLPRRHQTASTTAPISHDFWAKFLFKNRCISLLFFNF